MLATLVAEPFSNADWIFEPKLDGVRCLAYGNGGAPRLFSRNRIPLNSAYPELVEALAGLTPASYILDGEVVALREGIPSFSDLQQAKRRKVKIAYYLFDLLYLEGFDLRDVPLLYRKELLRAHFQFRAPIYFVKHRARQGEAYFREMCANRWEGLVAKRAGSTYVSKRSRDWLKIRCSAEQEFVLGGYTEPAGQRIGLGALLLGYYEGESLKYAGKVGTGFDTKTLTDLKRELTSLETKTSPFPEEVKAGRRVHWVKPKLLAQIAFTEWTHDGRLRHPCFLGIRQDKRPREVVRERPHNRPH